MTDLVAAPANRTALAAGAFRALSGLSFLVAPQTAQRMWSTRPADDPTARLLLRSMGYRDLLIGGGLAVAALRDSDAVPMWFLASAGADLADLVGGLAVRDELGRRDHVVGLGGATVGIAVGVAGALCSRRLSAVA